MRAFIKLFAFLISGGIFYFVWRTVCIQHMQPDKLLYTPWAAENPILFQSIVFVLLGCGFWMCLFLKLMGEDI
jgi:hypothetical protein